MKKSEDGGGGDWVGKNQNTNRAWRENQKEKNDLGMEGWREEKENSKFKTQRKVERQLWERKVKGKRIRIGRVITVAGRCLTPDLGSLIHFAMRHMVRETGGHSTECMVDTELFFLCSNADF